jgi:hypothetical protein
MIVRQTASAGLQAAKDPLQPAHRIADHLGRDERFQQRQDQDRALRKSRRADE